MLATTEDRDVRDPAAAIRLAEATVRASAASEPAVLDTLAVAQAAAGDAAWAAEIEQNRPRYRAQQR